VFSAHVTGAEVLLGLSFHMHYAVMVCVSDPPVPQDVLVLTHYKSPDTPRRAGNAPHQSQGAPLITAIIKVHPAALLVVL